MGAIMCAWWGLLGTGTIEVKKQSPTWDGAFGGPGCTDPSTVTTVPSVPRTQGGQPDLVALDSVQPSGPVPLQLCSADFRSWPKEEPVHPLAMSEVLPHETRTQAGIPPSLLPASHTAGHGPLQAIPGTVWVELDPREGAWTLP